MRLNLRTRLMLGLGAVFVLMVVMAFVLFDRFGAANREARDNYTQGLIGVKVLGDAITDIGHVRERLLLITSAANPSEVRRQAALVRDDRQQVEDLIAVYEAQAQSVAAQAVLNDFQADWDQYLVSSYTVAALAIAGDSDEARLVLLSETDPRLADAINALLIAQDIEDNDARARYDKSQDLYRQAQLFGAGLIMVTVVAGVGLAYWLARTIANPLANMAQTAERIAAGDLEQVVEIPARRRDEVGVLARAFNSMTAQLQESIGHLEARVQARTRDLQVAAQVSEQVATILDPEQLLPQVVELTKNSFDLYHAHVYLYDAKRDYLVLAAGAGEAGRIMKESGHRILASARSLVAQAARQNRVVIVDDVRAEPNFLPNPLLSDTHSEAAVPLAVGERVIGVLDVQSEQVARFDRDLISVLSTFSGQIAVSLDNARLFSEMERTSRQERVLGVITQEIQRATSIEDVLQVATRELGKALRVSETAIELYLPGDGQRASEPEASR